METINIKTEVLASLTGISQQELITQFTNEETNEVLPTDEVSSKIHDLIGAKMSNISEQQRKRGTRESLSGKEKEIAEAYGVEKGRISDMINAIVEKTKNETKESVTGQQAEGVQMMQTKLDAMKQKLAEQQNEFKTERTRYEKEKVISKVVSKGVEAWKALNPDLSDDENIRARQIDMFKSQLKSGNYKLDGDNIVVLDSDGNPKEDSNYNTITFADHVAMNNFLPIRKAEKPNHKNPPRPSGNGGNSSQFTKEEVTDSSKYASRLSALRGDGNMEAAKKLVAEREAYVTGK